MVATGTESAGQGFADENLRVGFDHLQMLFVRVDCNGVSALDTNVIQSIDGIVARAATADDDDPWIAELIVVHVDIHISGFLFSVFEGVLYDILHRYTFAQFR